MTPPIVDQIRSAENLPTLPQVAIEVLRVTRADDFDMDALVDVIQNDPASAARVLKLVNSPLFGTVRAVTSISQAVTLMGWRTARVMVLSFSLVETMRESESPIEFDFEIYWRHAVTTAVGARLLASAAGSRCAEEAFVTGLLSNIGVLAAVRCAPDLYGAVLEEARTSSRPIEEIERDRLTIDRAQMAAELLSDWGIPPMICDAVSSRVVPQPDLDAKSAELTRTLRAAYLVADLFCCERPSSELRVIQDRVCELLGIDLATVESVLETLDGHVRKTAALLSLPIGDSSDYARIQSEVAVALTQLSLESEVERRAADSRANEANRRVSRLEDEKRVILKAASTDALTGIANRTAFDARVSEELARAKAGGRPIAIAVLDVDEFKKFNDEHGHLAGDEALRAVGMVLRRVAGSTGFAARYGGEEFVIVFSGAEAASAGGVAEKARHCLEGVRVKHEGRTLSLTASVGVALIERPDAALASDQLFGLADTLLYQAKQEGRNRVVACRWSSGAASEAPVPLSLRIAA